MLWYETVEVSIQYSHSRQMNIPVLDQSHSCFPMYLIEVNYVSLEQFVGIMEQGCSNLNVMIM